MPLPYISSIHYFNIEVKRICDDAGNKIDELFKVNCMELTINLEYEQNFLLSDLQKQYKILVDWPDMFMNTVNHSSPECSFGEVGTFHWNVNIPHAGVQKFKLVVNKKVTEIVKLRRELETIKETLLMSISMQSLIENPQLVKKLIDCGIDVITNQKIIKIVNEFVSINHNTLLFGQSNIQFNFLKELIIHGYSLTKRTIPYGNNFTSPLAQFIVDEMKNSNNISNIEGKVQLIL
jgi:hypothetical protein